jgi:PAS domain S-box-containing protein
MMGKPQKSSPWGRQIADAVPRLLQEPGTRPEIILSVAGLSLAVPVLVINFVFLPQVSFALLYLLIVIFATWADGKKAGILIASASSFGLLLCETHGDIGPGVVCWDMGIQIVISLTAVFLVSAVRNRTGHLKQQVAARVAALEHEINDRTQTEEKLDKTMQQFRQMAENIADAFWMRDPESERMLYVSPAYETIWKRNCRELYQSPDAWLASIHPEDRQQVLQAMGVQQASGEYNQKYRIVRPDGTLRWIRDRTFPIRDGSGKVIRIVGIAEDITEQHQLESQILEISDREQARIGQDLHDSLCQKLVSIAFDNNSLEQKLADQKSPEAETVRQIALILDDAITEARLMARGLFPVQLETSGLGLALQQLTAGVSGRLKIDCRLECPQPVFVRDNSVATHLYRIVQEAVNNAVRHGRANVITVELKTTDSRIELRVTDNGIGLRSTSKRVGGMGLHIMNYRARTIGGVLSIEQANGRGTTVYCSVSQQER